MAFSESFGIFQDFFGNFPLFLVGQGTGNFVIFPVFGVFPVGGLPEPPKGKWGPNNIQMCLINIDRAVANNFVSFGSVRIN